MFDLLLTGNRRLFLVHRLVVNPWLGKHTNARRWPPVQCPRPRDAP